MRIPICWKGELRYVVPLSLKGTIDIRLYRVQCAVMEYGNVKCLAARCIEIGNRLLKIRLNSHLFEMNERGYFFNRFIIHNSSETNGDMQRRRTLPFNACVW